MNFFERTILWIFLKEKFYEFFSVTISINKCNAKNSYILRKKILLLLLLLLIFLLLFSRHIRKTMTITRPTITRFLETISYKIVFFCLVIDAIKNNYSKHSKNLGNICSNNFKNIEKI